MLKRMFKPFTGVEGGIFLKGARFQALGQKYPAFKTVNNALWLAPAWKWILSIVPLYGAYTGSVPVEMIDLNQSLALSFTGVVWSYYGLIVRPTAYLLVSCNVVLLGVNGTNVVRKYLYDQKQLLMPPPVVAAAVLDTADAEASKKKQD